MGYLPGFLPGRARKEVKAMAYQIRVVPSELRAAANQQREILSELRESVATLDSLRAQLDEAWDGQSGAAAVQLLIELRNGLKSVTENGIEDSAKSLVHVANCFESIDENGAMPPVMPRPDLNEILKMPDFNGFASAILGAIQNLRIIPEQVYQVSKQCDLQANKVQEKATQYMGLSRGLAESWEGKAYDRYIDMAEQIYVGLNHIAQAITEYSQKIYNAAKYIEQVDNSLM